MLGWPKKAARLWWAPRKKNTSAVAGGSGKVPRLWWLPGKATLGAGAQKSHPGHGCPPLHPCSLDQPAHPCALGAHASLATWVFKKIKLILGASLWAPSRSPGGQTHSEGRGLLTPGLGPCFWHDFYWDVHVNTFYWNIKAKYLAQISYTHNAGKLINKCFHHTYSSSCLIQYVH